MVSKKDALVLGVLAVGGVGLALSVGEGGGGGGTTERFGAIVGSSKKAVDSPLTKFTGTITGEAGTALGYKGYVTPITPTPFKPYSDRVVGTTPKKITPYLYTGGEVKEGAVSVAPWAMGRTTPAEIGVTTALSLAQKKSVPSIKKKVITGRAVTPGRMGYGKSYAKTHGLGGD